MPRSSPDPSEIQRRIRWQAAAIKEAHHPAQVWASKWNDRAWLSRRARGVPDSTLFMAALLQQARLCRTWP